MLSYHNDEKIKQETIKRAKAHVKADMLLKGSYWDSGESKGCSVGCHAHELGLGSSDHNGMAEKLGWPEWLVHLQDAIFEGLGNGDSAQWHIDIVSAVPVGAELRPAYHRICARILREIGWFSQQTESDEWGVRDSVESVAKLHDQQCDDQEKWSAARYWPSGQTYSPNVDVDSTRRRQRRTACTAPITRCGTCDSGLADDLRPPVFIDTRFDHLAGEK